MYRPSMKRPAVTAQRSAIMAKVKSKGNASTELRVAGRLARSAARGWKKHPKDVDGCPDFFFKKKKIAVFVDGCFWHGCPICKRRTPKTRRSYWQAKIAANRQRDRNVRTRLRAQGIRVVRVWEHEVTARRWLDTLLDKVHS